MEKKRIQPQDILKISWLLSSVLCCSFWELCGGKKAHSTPRYLEDILVSIFCALLCFLGALWWKKRIQPRDILGISWFLPSVLCCAFWELCGGKKRIQPRDILRISWFLSSVLCCAFWELCGGRKAHSTPRYLEDILVSILCALLCFLGALWWKKAHSTPRYLGDILVSTFCALLCFLGALWWKKAQSTPRYLEDILVSIFCALLCFLGASWWKKAHSTPRYLEDILVSIFCALLCFLGACGGKKRIQPRDILKTSWFLSSVLCCAFWELCGGKKAHSTPRYLEDILVSIFCALLCFLGALWWKKRIQPRDILRISWFLSSVLCCAFWELCGGKKAHSTPRYLEDILVSIFCALLCFLGALWWKKSAFNSEIS